MTAALTYGLTFIAWAFLGAVNFMFEFGLI